MTRLRPAPAIFAAATTIAGLIFILWPELDITFQALFYRPGEGFFLKDSLFAVIFYEGIRQLTPVVIGLLVVLLGLSLHRRIRAHGVNPRVVAFVLLAVALGPGLVVNTVFKDQWGRARPSQVVEFGGDRQFTPAFVPSDQCERNCSFVAGHPSMLFALFAPVLLLKRRRRVAMLAVIGLGALAGLGRIMQGAHFLSDVIFSGVFTFLVAWLLHEGLFKYAPGASRANDSQPLWRWVAVDRVRGAVPNDWHLVLPLIVGGLAWLGIAFVDRPLAHWFKQYDDTLLRDVFGAVTHLGTSAYYLIPSFFLFVWTRLALRREESADRRERLRRWGGQASFVFVMVAGTTLLVNVLKIFIGRARPRMLFSEDLYGFFPFTFDYDYWSLPSGHAATIVAVVMAFYILWPKHLRLYVVAVILVCASRVIISTHYLSDVVVGAYVAFVGSFGVRYLYEKAAAFRLIRTLEPNPSRD